MGFVFEPGTYLRDGWNIIDFIVVVTGIIGFFPGQSNLSAIRTIRMLRPLRSIQKISGFLFNIKNLGIKILVQSLIEALPALANVVVFLMFIMILFGILGVQLFGGIYEYRCRVSPKPFSNGNWPIVEGSSRLCSSCPKGSYCGAPSQYNIAFDQKELLTEDLNYGINNFDNILWATLTVFQVLTTEGWSQIVAILSEAYERVVVMIFFCLLIVFGNYFLMNLILAVVNEAFLTSKTMKKDEKNQNEEKEEDIKKNDIDEKSISNDKFQESKKEIKENQYIVVPYNENTNIKDNFTIRKLLSTDNDISQNNSVARKDYPENIIESSKESKNNDSLAISNVPDENIISFNEINKRNLNKDYQNLIQKDWGSHITTSEKNLEKGKSINEKNLLSQQKFVKKGSNESEINLFEIKEKKEKKRSFEEDSEFKKLEKIEIEDKFKENLEEKSLNESTDEVKQKKEAELSKRNECNIVINNEEENSRKKKTESIQHIEEYNPSLNIEMKKIDVPSIEIAIESEQKEKMIRKERMVLLNFFKTLANSRYFLIVTTLIIISNTIVLAFDRYPISKSENNKLETANLVFTIFFILEMIIKLLGKKLLLITLGLGLKGYVQDSMNIFDGIIVLSSIIEQIVKSTTENDPNNLSVIAAFRIFKLARSWTSLRNLIKAITMSVSGIINFLILLLLFMIVSSLLGMEFFAYRIRLNEEEGSPPRNNFDNFLNSMRTIFVLLTAEDWNAIMYEHVLASGSSSALFFVCIVVFGNFVLLNLFLSMLINNFAEASLKVKEKENQNSSEKKEEIFEIKEKSLEIKDRNFEIKDKSLEIKNDSNKILKINEEIKSNLNLDSKIENNVKKDNINEDKDLLNNQPQVVRRNSIFTKKSSSGFFQNDEFFVEKMKDGFILENKSLYLFSEDNKLRIFCSKIIKFDGFIMGVIIFSSILLAANDPLVNPESKTKQALNIIDYIITLIFIIEMLIKMITLGFIINGKNSYLRNGWNVLDFSIVLISIFSFIFEQSASGKNLSYIKIIRILRVLRPLRLISRNEGLRLAINSLIRSVPNILNLLLVCSIFFFLFGIIGVNYFKGSFYYCKFTNDLDIKIVTKRDCLDYGGDWINNHYNFDNIFRSIVTLYILCSTENWVNMMFDGVDSRGIDLNPERDFRTYMSLFYILFILIGSLLIINLYTGVVCDSFNNENAKLGGWINLTEEQLEWVMIQKRLLRITPEKHLKTPKNKFRRICFKISINSKFESFILWCIIINVLFFLLKWHRQPKSLEKTSEIINFVFFGIFVCEAIIKIIGMGKAYFRFGWNIFDFCIVLLTLFGIILEQANVFENIGSSTSVIRAFRICRLLRLIKRAQALRTIFITFVKSLPAIANVGALLALLLFVYAVLGMNIFPYIKRRDVLNENFNFSTFGNSLYLLFVCTTGDGWSAIMAEISQGIDSSSTCLDVDSYNEYKQFGFNGCGNQFGFYYMISFQMFIGMILLNLFIAIILESFDETTKAEKGLIKSYDIDDFVKYWSVYNFDENFAFIHIDKFSNFMDELERPLGFKKMLLADKDKRLAIAHLNLPIYKLKNPLELSGLRNNVYFFFDALFEISRRYLEIIHDGKELDHEKNDILAYKILNKSKKKIVSQYLKSVELTKFNSAIAVANKVLSTHLFNKNDFSKKINRIKSSFSISRGISRESVVNKLEKDFKLSKTKDTYEKEEENFKKEVQENKLCKKNTSNELDENNKNNETSFNVSINTDEIILSCENQQESEKKKYVEKEEIIFEND